MNLETRWKCKIEVLNVISNPFSWKLPNLLKDLIMIPENTHLANELRVVIIIV